MIITTLGLSALGISGYYGFWYASALYGRGAAFSLTDKVIPVFNGERLVNFVTAHPDYNVVFRPGKMDSDGDTDLDWFLDKKEDSVKSTFGLVPGLDENDPILRRMGVERFGNPFWDYTRGIPITYPVDIVRNKGTSYRDGIIVIGFDIFHTYAIIVTDVEFMGFTITLTIQVKMQLKRPFVALWNPSLFSDMVRWVQGRINDVAGDIDPATLMGYRFEIEGKDVAKAKTTDKEDPRAQEKAVKKLTRAITRYNKASPPDKTFGYFPVSAQVVAKEAGAGLKTLVASYEEYRRQRVAVHTAEAKQETTLINANADSRKKSIEARGEAMAKERVGNAEARVIAKKGKAQGEANAAELAGLGGNIQALAQIRSTANLGQTKGTVVLNGHGAPSAGILVGAQKAQDDDTATSPNPVPPTRP